MDEFIKKLIERLEEEKGIAFLTLANTGNKMKDIVYDEVMAYLNTSIDIVNELAEECSSTVSKTEKNGWIACSERLPEVNGKYLVCIDNPTRNKKDCIFVFWFNAYDKEFERKHDLDYVLAWQPLPVPYNSDEHKCGTSETWKQQTMSRFERVE